MKSDICKAICICIAWALITFFASRTLREYSDGIVDKQSGIVADTIREVEHVTYQRPEGIEQNKLGTIIVSVPRSRGTGTGGPSRQCGPNETVLPADSNVCEPEDSIEVELPITQTVYRGDDYEAWVSGYQARLDSIRVAKRRETIIVRPKTNRWHIGPCVGLGVSAAGVQPFVGISISYSLISF